MVVPVGVMLGEQGFNRVAEALHSNAERVPRFWLLAAKGFRMKLPGALETFQPETFGGETPDGHETGAMAKSTCQALPGLLIEFGGSAERVLSQVRFL